MEIVVSSPASHDEEEQSPQEVPLPGLDVLSSDMNPPDSPVALSASPYSSDYSHSSREQIRSTEVGPATPSGDQSRDGCESPSASNPISQDEDSQQRLQRTPSSPDDSDEEGIVSGETEREYPVGYAPSSSMEPPVADAASSSMEPPIDDAASSSMEPPVDDAASSSMEPPVDDAPSSSMEPPVDDAASSSMEPSVVDAASPCMEPPLARNLEVEEGELADPSSPFPSTAVPGLDFGEEPYASAQYVPGLDSANEAPQKSKGMYAFLSTGQDEEEEEEKEEETAAPTRESIPFLGGDSVPSPCEEIDEEITMDFVKESNAVADKETEAQESIPFLGGDTIPSPGKEMDEKESNTEVAGRDEETVTPNKESIPFLGGDTVPSPGEEMEQEVTIAVNSEKESDSEEGGRDEEETEPPIQQSIPFLGGDTVPSPGEEMEQEVTIAVNSEKESDSEEGGRDEEETKPPTQESIPFLGGDTVPSPGVEMEQEGSTLDSEKESDSEKAQEESRSEVVIEAQVLSEVKEVVTESETHVVNDGNVETQMDVVEQVVETSEAAEIDESRTVMNVEEVISAEIEEKDSENPELVEVKETGEKAPKSPQQIVEEVFLNTDGGPKNQESEDESDFEGFEASEAAPKPTRKRRARVIDDDEEEGEESDFDGFDPEENKKGDRQGLIADIFDIFGHSDDEGEFDGFAEAEVPPVGQEVAPEGDIAEAKKAIEAEEEKDSSEGKKKKKDGESSSSSSEDEGVDNTPSMSHMSDFEAMMMRKKEENRRRRRRRGDNIENINVNDDLVVALISDMKMAASIDRDLIMQKMPAIQKLRMLPQVVGMLRKSDLQLSLIDCGVLSAITEWLSPLPDRSLPALPIRRSLLQALTQLPGIGADSLKESGVGKAVMYLNKHPKEVSDNKRMAGKLIYNWSRPIFDLTCDYKSLSKEERQKRDMENLPKKRSINAAEATPKRDIDKEMSGDSRPLRPGDPGWVARARVPMPSNKDYVVRPRSKVESAADEAAPPRKVGRFEKHIRKIKDSKGKVKFQKAVGMSLEGRKMSL